MCAISMLVGAPRNCSRFVCRYDLHEDVLDSVYLPSYCCNRIQYFALVIILSNSGERMHRDKIPPQRMHAACRIVTRGSCCAKRFAEFNGNCESYCSLEQLVASDEGKSAAGTYHPKTEGYYIRRHLYKPFGLPYCGGCTYSRISRQPIIANTWHFSQQTLLEQCYWPNVVIVAPRAKSVCSFVSLVQTNLGTTSVCSLVTLAIRFWTIPVPIRLKKTKKNGFGPFSYKFFVPIRVGLTIIKIHIPEKDRRALDRESLV